MQNDPIIPVAARAPPLPRRNDPKTPAVVTGSLFGAFAGVIVLGFLGLILSQYWPVFGGFLDMNLARPWSPARKNLIPIHLLVFCVTGIVLGTGAGALLALSIPSNQCWIVDVLVVPFLILLACGAVFVAWVVGT
jgi:p-aminobenzoyl-glutamate transporter AbgT